MASVAVTQPRADHLVIEIGRHLGRAAALLTGGSAVLSLMFWLTLESVPGVMMWVVAVMTLPLLGVACVRALRRANYVVVRTPGRLFLNGEPLEMARVELRVRQWPFTSRPRGYDLSLWVMTSVGPADLALGHFPTLMKASAVSGAIEDFVQRANVKSTGRAGANRLG